METEAAQKNESLSREDFLKFEWIVVGPRGNKRIVKVPRDRAKAEKERRVGHRGRAQQPKGQDRLNIMYLNSQSIVEQNRRAMHYNK